ncbi:uncharacterized protein sh2d7 [Aulostomus maculatus]
MDSRSGVDLHLEASEGGLKELVLRWFTGTQAPLILHNGKFPDWFQGFTTRRDAEDLLRDKALGCFLIRLSDKAIGYILSYRGLDRCRHFVITQNQDGLFVISGDCQTYHSLAELIEHYRVSPIQPFGEFLTSSCHEVNTGELYDVVNYNTKAKSGVSVQALRSRWDHQDNVPGNNQADPLTLQPPALPPKSKNRRLTGTVSADAMSLSQAVPPVPKRGLPLGFSLSGCLPDRSSHPGEPRMEPNRAERLRGNTKTALMSNKSSSSTSDPCPGAPAGVPPSQLIPVDSRSKSLPRLDDPNSEEEEKEEEEYSNQLSCPSFMASTYSSALVKRVTCHTYSLHDPRDTSRLSNSRPEQLRDELSQFNPLYQTSEGAGGSSAPHRDAMYAEVPQRQAPAHLPCDTYEQIPGDADVIHGNTYESLDDMKTKQSKSTWGKNNMKWKKFLPDYKKK